MKEIRLFEAFAGYGSQLMAMRRLEEKYPDKIKVIPVGISEIDKYAIKAYHAVHGEDIKNYGDISKINWDEVPDFDFLTYSSPCFVAGTLVLTENGYKKIEDITSEDRVITHTNTFQKVVKPMAKQYIGWMNRIKAMSMDSIECTPEHPFYVRKMERVWDNSIRQYRRQFTSPTWEEAQYLGKRHYVGIAINTKEELPKWKGVRDGRWGHDNVSNKLTEQFINNSFWYLMGRYVGDGWKKNSHTGNGIVICCGGRNEQKLIDAITQCDYTYCKVTERTVSKYMISSNELNAFVDRYGYYAYGKKIDAETMNLPVELLKSFIEGVMDADGCKTQWLYKITSVSRELIYSLAQCVAKVYKRPYSIYKTIRPKKTNIEGREVNQRDTYSLTYKLEKGKQDKAFYEDGYIWSPIKSVDSYQTVTKIYNMEVENDNSYTANGCIVHNCQDFSNAGKQAGGAEGSGTRSSLLWEVRRAILAKKPKYLLMENVSALVSQKFIGTFNQWQLELERYGYTNFAQVLNAKDYGVPQNREHIFMISILNCDEAFYFPTPFKLEKRLKDVLEQNVDESYYLSDKIIEGFNAHKDDSKK